MKQPWAWQRCQGGDNRPVPRWPSTCGTGGSCWRSTSAASTSCWVSPGTQGCPGLSWVLWGEDDTPGPAPGCWGSWSGQLPPKDAGSPQRCWYHTPKDAPTPQGCWFHTHTPPPKDAGTQLWGCRYSPRCSCSRGMLVLPRDAGTCPADAGTASPPHPLKGYLLVPPRDAPTPPRGAGTCPADAAAPQGMLVPSRSGCSPLSQRMLFLPWGCWYPPWQGHSFVPWCHSPAQWGRRMCWGQRKEGLEHPQLLSNRPGCGTTPEAAAGAMSPACPSVPRPLRAG